MPRRFFRRVLPDPSQLRKHKRFEFLGTRLHDANLWHINRRSLSGGLAVGLFVAFLPVPGQMLISAVLAVLLRINLPIAVAAVWVTNPLTIPPMFYFTYRVGAWILGTRETVVHPEPSLDWLTSGTSEIVWPLLLGSILVGLTSAGLGYLLIEGFWRWQIFRHLESRKTRRRKGRLRPP